MSSIPPTIGPNLRPTALDEIVETAGRRIGPAITAELKGIKDCLTQHPSNDAMTQRIEKWHDMFSKAFALRPAQFVVDAFMTSLKSILQDPVSHAHLDEESFLGSDGVTYAGKTLYIHNRSDRAQRPPLHSEDPTPFTFTPHHTVRYLVRWLQDHHALECSERHEQLFRDLKEKMEREEIRRHIKERGAKIEQERQQRLELIQRLRPSGEGDQLQIATNQIRQIVRDAEDFQTVALQRIENIERMGNERLDRIEQRPDPQVEFQRELRRVDHLMETALGNQIQVLESEIAELRRTNVHIHEQIKTIEQECAQVQLMILETDKAIKKAKKEQHKHLIQTLVIIGASPFATWAMSGLLDYLAVEPIPGGGMLRAGIFR